MPFSADSFENYCGIVNTGRSIYWFDHLTVLISMENLCEKDCGLCLFNTCLLNVYKLWALLLQKNSRYTQRLSRNPILQDVHIYFIKCFVKLLTHFLQTDSVSQKRYVHDCCCWFSAYCRTPAQTAKTRDAKSAIKTFRAFYFSFPHNCWLRAVAKTHRRRAWQLFQSQIALLFGSRMETQTALRSDHKIIQIPTQRHRHMRACKSVCAWVWALAAAHYQAFPGNAWHGLAAVVVASACSGGRGGGAGSGTHVRPSITDKYVM